MMRKTMWMAIVPLFGLLATGCWELAPASNPGDACATASDCTGQPAGASDVCLGDWQCVEAKCTYECKTGCTADTDCAKGQACTNGTCTTPAGTCLQTGCSGEVCSATPVYTDCVMKPWYDCLKLTTCGTFGAGGTCGFDQNAAFLACVNGGTCTADADCPPDDTCVNGACVAKTPAGCLVDGDCATTEYCKLEAVCPPCVTDPVSPCKVMCQQKGSCTAIPGCQADGDCPAGYACQLPQCDSAGRAIDPKIPAPPCGSAGVCVKQVIPTCSGGTEGDACKITNSWGSCLGSTVCVDGNWVCNGMVPAKEICDGIDNDCNGLVDDGCEQPIQCVTDTDCGANLHCVLPQAYDAAGNLVCCPANAKCVSGIPACGTGYCVLNDGLCWTDKDCPTGQTCQNLVNCAPDANCMGPYNCAPVTNPGCTSDKDCATGQHCAQPGTDQCCSGAYCGVDWPMCGTCVAAPVTGCTSDADCAYGQTCDFSGVDPTTCCLPGLVCLAIYKPCVGVCGTPLQPTCVASTPGSHGDCKMLLGYIFDGKGCVQEGGCACKQGVDCWSTVAECQAACGVTPSCTFDSDCGLGQYCDLSAYADMAGCCVPTDPSGAGCPSGYPVCPGVCRMQPGLCWTDADCGAGNHCEGAIKCPDGAMCLVADKPGTCVADATTCTAVKPYTHGACEMVLGYIFDGSSCVLESGCSCGADCAAFYKTQADCQAACTSQPVYCGSDTVCPAGETCKQFTQCPACTYQTPPCMVPCQAMQVCVAPCYSDGDCPSGFYCEITKCAAGTKCLGPYECQLLPVG